MRKTQRNPKPSYFKLEPDAGGVIARRKTSLLADGAYVFEDELQVFGVLSAQVITCTAWLLEFYELQAGDVFFASGPREIRASATSFGIFYPPFTISKPTVENARGRLIGIAATEPLPVSLTGIPRMFEAMCTKLPTGVTEVLEVIRLGKNPQSVEMNPQPSLLSVKAKELIDENYLSYPSISRVARRLGVTHEHLSRQFKRDFDFSPSTYLHQLRLADAPLRLARGEEIINVSQDVGYNDLSRFYKQFRKSTKTSPGACQTMMKPDGV